MATLNVFATSVPIPTNQPPYNPSSLPIPTSSSHQAQLNNGFSASPLDILTYNKLLSYHIKNGRLEHAHNVFDQMPQRDEVSWSTIISAYTRSKDFILAFQLFKQMMEEGVTPNEFAIGSLLNASSEVKQVRLGRQLHGLSIRTGFGLEAGVLTSLITMYSKCGFLNDAQLVFYLVPVSLLDDTRVWNSIIIAYIFHECWIEAIRLFGTMVSTGIVEVKEPFYASIVSACANARVEKYGKAVHGRLAKCGLSDDVMIANSLITFYAKCGDMEVANKLFHVLDRKSVVSWNSIIAGNKQNDEPENAIRLFSRMLRMPSMQPNRITFLSVLSAVSGVSGLRHGREIHGHIIRIGLKSDASIANSLITMYSKCREVGKARFIFELLPYKDMVTWNSMLAGLEENNHFESLFCLFNEMLSSGIEPDNHTFTVVLSATASLPSELKHLSDGRAVHGYILRSASPGGLDVSTCNAILLMYASNNLVDDAERIFRTMSLKDCYTWNTMMDAYSLNGRPHETLTIYLDMLEQALPPNSLTFSILLTACSKMVSFELGKQIHSLIVKYMRSGDHKHQNSLSVNNALISMYSKCGSISDANRVFVRMRTKDVFSWTAMITGNAQHGIANESLQLFEAMKQNAIKPNGVTFLGVLTACAHAGLVEEGTYYFDSMSKDYGLNPSIEHYACMVDLFSRSGQLEQAEELVEAGITLFNSNPGGCLSLWKVLLGACHTRKELEVGVRVGMRILASEPEDETTHILLSNLYAASGKWEDAIRVRRWMRDKGLTKKEIGCSWIESGSEKHVFVAGDVCHPQRKEIYAKLGELSKKSRRMGYVPMTEYVLHDVDERQKEVIIGYHSEKLAVSFGLLQSNGGSKGVIRVIKNLRVCGDCHNWMKFVSQVEGREIIMRDSRRFHLFKDGRCSCRDYW